MLLGWRSAVPILIAFLTPSARAADPYSGIESYRLQNGMTVVLAPSSDANTVQINLRVKAGEFNDGPGQAGIAHLLEHLLFTNATNEKGMTYLEIIKEKGGHANASTTGGHTQYFATVPPRLTDWTIRLFSQMILAHEFREFDEANLPKIKGPVTLEIGERSLLDYVTAGWGEISSAMGLFPDFWETEFAVNEPPASLAEARLDIGKISMSDLREFYRKYYHPDNLTLFLSGNFRADLAKQVIADSLGKEPARSGGTWEYPAPRPRQSSYFRSSSTWGTASIEIGTKADSLDLDEEVAARVYLNSLSHRLMKEIRNLKGDTYTVRPIVSLRKGYGKMTVSFEVPAKSYQEYLRRVRGLIQSEAREGVVSQEVFEEAKSLYLENFEVKDRDSHTLMHSAERWRQLEETYPSRARDYTDYQAFRKLDYETFRAHLKKVFTPGRSYESLVEPPLFFRYEEVLLLILGFGIWMKAARFCFAKKFNHSQIRWVRKLNFPPAYCLPFLATAFSIFIGAVLSALLQIFWWKAGLTQMEFLISDYLSSFFCLGVLIFSAQWVLGCVVRKAMVSERSLWIKSLAYSSQVVPLDQIEDLSVRRGIQVFFSPHDMVRVKYRFYFYDPRFWNEGVLLRLKNGSAYFLGIRDSRLAAEELRAMITLVAHSERPAESRKQGVEAA